MRVATRRTAERLALFCCLGVGVLAALLGRLGIALIAALDAALVLAARRGAWGRRFQSAAIIPAVLLGLFFALSLFFGLMGIGVWYAHGKAPDFREGLYAGIGLILVQWLSFRSALKNARLRAVPQGVSWSRPGAEDAIDERRQK
jgi:hypothetical protein